jgi:hypothetical protein
VFENRVLRRIFRSKREEVPGGWRTAHNEELRNLYASPNNFRVINSRRMRRTGYVARMGEMRNADNILVGKHKEKRPLGRTRHKWEDILIDVRKIVWEGVGWIHMPRDRDQWRAVVNTVMKLRVP